MQRYSITRGHLRHTLAEVPDNSFDGMLCDPPYGFKFMAKSWDYDVPAVEDWRACLRVLKPGAAMLAFGGARTFHRIVVGIEDAGFEIRDQLQWLYAKGFPKSLNVSKALDKAAGAERKVIGTRTLQGNAALSCKEKGGTYASIGLDSSGRSVEVPVTAPASELARQWEGYGTALKPGQEPICLARKPLDGTVAENVMRWGVGALAIDACRIATDEINRSEPWVSSGADNGVAMGKASTRLRKSGTGANHEDGRWPANLLFDEDAAAILDAEVAPRKSGLAVRVNGGGGQIFSDIRGNGHKPKPPLPNIGYIDGKTNPSRFFFCTKVGRKERELGCEGLALKSAGEMTEREDGSDGLSSPRAGAGRTGGARNHHPTLKPVALTEYLARLIMPPTPDAVLLVPYSGAGSEMIGALSAGWPMVFGIELDLDEDGQPAGYIDIARARLKAWHPDAAAIE